MPGVNKNQLKPSLQGERNIVLTVIPEPTGTQSCSETSTDQEEIGSSTIAISDKKAKGASYFTLVTLPRVLFLLLGEEVRAVARCAEEDWLRNDVEQFLRGLGGGGLGLRV